MGVLSPKNEEVGWKNGYGKPMTDATVIIIMRIFNQSNKVQTLFDVNC